MVDKSPVEQTDQLNCRENFFQLEQDLVNILNKNRLDSLYDSDYDSFVPNRRQSPSKQYFNPYYPMDKDIIESRPMTPIKNDYSPNNILYPKEGFHMNEEFQQDHQEPKKGLDYITEDMIPMDHNYVNLNQRPKAIWKNPFTIEEKEEFNSDTNYNFLSSFWPNVPNHHHVDQSPNKKPDFQYERNDIKHLSSLVDSDDEALRTPQKPVSFINKGKSMTPFIKKEEKMSVNFKNYCPEQFENENEYYNKVSYSFPRQEKKENPFWLQSKFLSEKKAIQEKINKNRETPHRSERGLRVLSLRVKDIVCEKNHTTYKQVAESLINQMESQQDIKENCKDEQNIKRRVYDALNVLIAADVLKKSGKTVHIDEHTGLIGKYCKTNMTQEKLKFHRKIMEMEHVVQLKKSMLQESLLKIISLKQLVDRNKELLEIRTMGHDEIIRIPFIMLVLPHAGLDSIEIIQNYRNKNQLKILSKEALSLYGDVDILLKLNFFRVDKKKLEEYLPKETHKYLPDEIKDQK